MPSQIPLSSLPTPFPSPAKQSPEGGGPRLSRRPVCSLPNWGPSARSWHVAGLPSAPFPGGRARTLSPPREDTPFLVLGCGTLMPLLPSPRCSEAKRPGDSETAAQNTQVIYTHHTPPVPRVHPAHAHTRPHAPENLTRGAQVVSYPRARRRGCVAAHESRPGPMTLGGEGHLLLHTKAPALLAMALATTQESPPPSGLSGLLDLRTPRPTPALPTGRPRPTWGPLTPLLLW